MSFVDWLYGRGGVPGNFDYGTNYIISISIIVALTILIGVIAGLKCINDKTKKWIIYSIAIFQLTFEVVWRIIYFCRGDAFLSLWPFYACNLNGILVPIACLTNNKTMKEMFYVFGFIGGILTFALPQGIFSNSVMVFPIVKSLLQHISLLFIPVFEFVSGRFRPKLKNIWLAILGMLIHVVNSVYVSAMLGYPGDYLYFNSGMPFVIDGVPGWVVMSVTAIIVVVLLYFLLNIKNLIKKKNTKPAKIS